MIPPPREIPDGAPRLADGRYVLLSRIGRGGMAGVYAAWDQEIEEWRAIKVLLPKHARDGGLRMRFEREGLTMKSLQHPNLVRVFGVGSGEKLPFLVMELINAGSLYRWTKTHGAMPARMATEAMIQLCSGVSAVHAAGVVHRDIKPRNVLINWDGVLKLTDFGIAQLGGSQETRTGLAMGTLGFMSPEQLHDSKSVDLRTDIYAIGATLWSQITGRKARDLFRMEEDLRMMDGVPEPLRPVLMRCLAYDRVDRYPSARSLSDALSTLLPALDEDPDHSPPLPLNLGSLSFKSKPESMFSEILTTLNGDADSSQHSGGSGSEDDRPRAATPGVARTRQTVEVRREPAPRRAPPDPERPSLPDQSGVRSPAGPHPTPTPSQVDVELRAVPPSLYREGYSRARTAGGRSLGDTGAAIAERWSKPDDPADLPSYMIGVDQPADRARPELITYEPEPEPAPAASTGVVWIRRLLAVVILAPLGTVAALVAIVAVVAGIGAWQVRSASSELAAARGALSDRLAQEEALPRELELLGADGSRVHDAYRRWDQASAEPDRTRAAMGFLELAALEAQARVRLSGRTHEEEIVRQRVDRLAVAGHRVLEAEEALGRASVSGPGRLSIVLHLASASELAFPPDPR